MLSSRSIFSLSYSVEVLESQLHFSYEFVCVYVCVYECVYVYDVECNTNSQIMHIFWNLMSLANISRPYTPTHTHTFTHTHTCNQSLLACFWLRRVKRWPDLPCLAATFWKDFSTSPGIKYVHTCLSVGLSIRLSSNIFLKFFRLFFFAFSS